MYSHMIHNLGLKLTGKVCFQSFSSSSLKLEERANDNLFINFTQPQ